MNNGDEPATACEIRASEQAKALGYFTNHTYTGLTKREAFAMAAMQGLLAEAQTMDNLIAINAVKMADDLLKQLEKVKQLENNQ